MHQVSLENTQTSLTPDEVAALRRISISPCLKEILEAIQRAGGCGWIVGGAVRDALLGHVSPDIDIEVFGLTASRLEAILKTHGPVSLTGRHFGVFRVGGLDVDFALPRREQKNGAGHRGFDIETCPEMTFKEAAGRRELTINSMGYDPLTGVLEDPYDGRIDLKKGRLHYIDPKRFQEDPLRPLRVMQFAARFRMQPTPELIDVSSRMPLDELPRERVAGAFHTLLTRGVQPSLGLEFLRAAHLLSFFPEWLALKAPAWQDMCRAMDALAGRADIDLDNRETFLMALLGYKLPRNKQMSLWRRICLREDLRHRAALLTDIYGFCILPKSLLEEQIPYVRAWARQLAKKDLSWVQIKPFLDSCLPSKTVQEMWQAIEAGRVASAPLPQVVMAADLMAHGIEEGPELGRLLKRVQEIQDMTGLVEPQEILGHLWAEKSQNSGSFT